MTSIEHAIPGGAYLSNKMTGHPDYNYGWFHRITSLLRKYGWTVTNPAEAFDGRTDLPFADYMRNDVGELLKVETVIVGPEWRESPGAVLEVSVAVAMGLEVLAIREEIGGFTLKPALPLFERDRDRLEHVLLEGLRHQDVKADGYAAADQAQADELEARVLEAAAFPSRIILPADASGEVRTVSATGGEKGVKPARFDLIPPGFLWALAEHFGVGARKYDDNNWQRGYEWSKSYGALQRHLFAWIAGEDIDAETGSNHLIAVAWHACCLHWFSANRPEFDDRPKGAGL